MKLNEDVIIEVLLRLPVKSLVRYKSVCKKWRDIIDNSDFVNQHLNLKLKLKLKLGDDHDELIVINHYDQVMRKNIITCYEYDNDVADKLFLTPLLQSNIVDDLQLTVSTHCNGIVCLTNFDSLQNNIIALMNPSLGGEFRTLQASPLDCPSEFNSRVSGVGFGFDRSINNYKVVRFVSFIPKVYRIPSESYLEAQVYDLSTTSWRRSDRMHHVTFTNWYDECPPVLFNGILHLCMLDDSYHILTFNITTELFRKMELPKDYYDELTDGFSNDIGGMWRYWPRIFVMDKYSTIALVGSTSPYLCRSRNGSSHSKMDVWIMKEYGVRESWSKQYSVVLPDSRVSKPLSLWKKQNHLLLLFVTVDGKLMCSNLATGEQHQLEQYQFQRPSEPISCPCGHLVREIRGLFSFGVVITNQTLLSVNKI